jgi:Icc-related predicted phosphoesterase
MISDPELLDLTLSGAPLVKTKRAPQQKLTPPKAKPQSALVGAVTTPRILWEVVSGELIDGLLPMEGGYTPHVELVRVRSDLFTAPVIVTSDLHKDGGVIFTQLQKTLRAADWEVILCGDMAGTTRRGEDASITPLFDLLQSSYKALHFVYGNHDISEDKKRINPDGTSCRVDGAPRMVAGRRVCGVSGVIGNSKKRHRKLEKQFLRELDTALGEEAEASVFCTHETPAMLGFTPPIGKEELTQAVIERAPLVHFFGHCHLKPLQVLNGQTLFVDADARVLLIEPLRHSGALSLSKGIF